MKTKRLTVKNVVAYLQGNFRYFLITKLKGFGVTNTIKEQVEYRTNSLNYECEIECIKCGCPTHKTVYANRSCKGFCYPTFVSEKQFEQAKKSKYLIQKNKMWFLCVKNKTFK